MFIMETHAGDAYERGLDHGRTFRHLIHAHVHVRVIRQPFQATEQQYEQVVAPQRQVIEKHLPELFDELRGIAEGSEVEYRWIERLQFHTWHTYPRVMIPHDACTGIGLMTTDKGTVIGGALDADARAGVALTRHQPKGARSFIQMQWIGAAWGHNGVNEAGLAVTQQSLKGFKPPINYDCAADALTLPTARQLLMHCDTVFDALAWLEKWPNKQSLILGDKAGTVVAASCWGRVFAQFIDDTHMVWNCNQVHYPQPIEWGRQQGSVAATNRYSRTRQEYLFGQVQEAKGQFTYNDMVRMMRSTEGHPYSVCNDETVMATIAPVQDEPGVIYVADRPPSRNEFMRYSL